MATPRLPAPPKGIYVPVPTFFKQNSDEPHSLPLDLETQTKHSLFLMKAGITGLVILGSTGEAITIRPQERHDLISSQRKALDEANFTERPIIAGTTSHNIDETLEVIAASKVAGAVYAMVLAPNYFASITSQAGIKAWFTAVADRSVMPILIYHYPGVTNNLNILPQTIVDLSQHPNIVGCKLSHGSIPDHTLIAASSDVDHGNFVTFTGLGQNLLPFLSVGGSGSIDGLAGIFPRVVSSVYKRFNSSDGADSSKTATEWPLPKLQHLVCQGEKLVEAWGVVGIKEALDRVWQIGDRRAARLPLTGGFPVGDAEWTKWEEVMQKLKALEESLARQP